MFFLKVVTFLHHILPTNAGRATMPRFKHVPSHKLHTKGGRLVRRDVSAGRGTYFYSYLAEIW